MSLSDTAAKRVNGIAPETITSERKAERRVRETLGMLIPNISAISFLLRYVLLLSSSIILRAWARQTMIGTSLGS